MDSVTLSVEELPLGVTALPPLLVLGVAQVTSDGNSPFLSPSLLFRAIKRRYYPVLIFIYYISLIVS